MTQRPTERIRDAFGDNSDGYVETYLEALRNNWKDVSDAITRTSLFLFLLVAVFELIAYSDGKLNIGPIEIENPDLVQKTLPVVVAYLFLEALMLTGRWASMADVYADLMKSYHPGVYRWDFEYHLMPRLLTLWSFWMLGGRMSNRFRDTVSVVLFVAVLTSIVVFEVHAYYRLFYLFRASDLLVWISLAASAILIAVSALFAYIVWHEAGIDPRSRMAR